MADSAISALSAVTTVNDTDVVPIVQGGASMKATIARMNRKVMNSGPATAQVLTAGSTDQYLTNSSLTLAVAPNVLTVIQFKVILSKTSAAGTAALIFNLKKGTAGTTADTSICTFTFGASTAAIDVGRLDVLATFRSVGSGTSAVIQSSATLTHSASAAGLLAIPAQTLAVTSTGVDSTTGLIYGLTCTPGTSNTITVSQVVSEAVNV